MARRRVLQLGGLAVLVAFVVLLGIAVHNAQNKGSFARSVAKGELPPAPSFSLKAVDGSGSVSLAALRGRPVVLNFWASWCAPCEDEAPLLRQVAAAEVPKGVAFVGINAKDTTDGALAFIARYRPGYPQVSGGSIADRYGVSQFPETFVVDRQGRTVAWFPGEIEPETLRAAIEKASS
jgi:cytochrome c biogenesis protein CcmG/thiol:disulfide interchange protein DsbE